MTMMTNITITIILIVVVDDILSPCLLLLAYHEYAFSDCLQATKHI